MKHAPTSASKSKLFALLFASTVAATAAQAQTNIAPTGTGILGVVATASDTTSGTSQNHQGTGSPGPISNINDGSLTTVADDFPGSSTVAAGTAGESFAGVTFATPVTLGLGSNVTLYLNLFTDGGWFGVPSQNAGGAGTGTGGALSATSLVDPHVQYTLNGTTWITLAGVTDNYVSQYTGATAGSTTSSHIAATFNLNVALAGVEGLRLTGTNGGTANNQGGFISLQEFQVNAVPEPSAYVFLAGGLMALLGRRSFARRQTRLG